MNDPLIDSPSARLPLALMPTDSVASNSLEPMYGLLLDVLPVSLASRLILAPALLRYDVGGFGISDDRTDEGRLNVVLDAASLAAARRRSGVRGTSLDAALVETDSLSESAREMVELVDLVPSL